MQVKAIRLSLASEWGAGMHGVVHDVLMSFSYRYDVLNISDCRDGEAQLSYI